MLNKIATAVLLSSALFCAGIPALGSPAAQTQTQTQQPGHKVHKKKQAEPPPPLPSGPTGQPVPPMPLDSMTAVPPQVTYENNQLTIVAPNSTLSDILRAVRKQTGAEIEVPSAPERVVTRLGPGPAREVLADLLNGSRFNYVLLGSPSDEAVLTRVVLVAKSGSPQLTPNAIAAAPAPFSANQPNQPQPENAVEANEVADDTSNGDDNPDPQPQPAEAEQAPPSDPNAVKTPQQMLQEIQQRQMQMQQQTPGQTPVQGSGMPPHPPREN